MKVTYTTTETKTVEVVNEIEVNYEVIYQKIYPIAWFRHYSGAKRYVESYNSDDCDSREEFTIRELK